jgi:uncharacterized protein (TIGR03435 family)
VPLKRLPIAGLFLVALSTGQQTAPRPAFEVASVKLAGDEESRSMAFKTVDEMKMRFHGGPGTPTPERVDFRGVTLRMLIRRAYELVPEQVVGPEWLDKQRYSIAAKLPPHATLDQSRLMLQDLLDERFELHFHRENRTLPVYHLLVSKGGAKVHPSKPVTVPDTEEDNHKAGLAGLAEANRLLTQDRGFHPTDVFTLPSATIPEFINRLSRYLDRPVINHTQMDQRYRFSLVWVAASTTQTADTTLGPSLFAAIEEQLGMELRAAKERMEVLVIDSARKTPIEN